MNYLKQLKAFRDWLLLNDLNTSAIALWHTLMSINNMTGWKERFNAPNPTVEKLTGLSKQGLVDARKKLIENGLIEYEKGRKGKAPVYKIIPLVNSFDQYTYQSDYQNTYQSNDQSDDKDLTIPKHKQDINKTSNSSSNTRVEEKNNPFILFEKEGFGTLSGTLGEILGEMIDEYSEEWVMNAMKQSAMQGKRTLKYVEGILKNWKSSGIDGERRQQSAKYQPELRRDSEENQSDQGNGYYDQFKGLVNNV